LGSSILTGKLYLIHEPYRDKNTDWLGISNAGGGGERVLWRAIASLQQKHKNVISVVYTGDIDATKDEILRKAQVRRPNCSLDTGAYG
jgi:hypothetical protein